MRLFGWATKSKPVKDDPVFGALIYEKKLREWHTTMSLPDLPDCEALLVSVDAGEDGPTERHRASFQRFREEYPSLVKPISEALLELYNPEREPEKDGITLPMSAAAMWRAAAIDSIAFYEDKYAIIYAFRDEDFWPDAMFVINIKGNTIESAHFQH